MVLIQIGSTQILLQVFHKRAAIHVLGVFLHPLPNQLRLRDEPLFEVVQLVREFVFRVEDASLKLMLTSTFRDGVFGCRRSRAIYLSTSRFVWFVVQIDDEIFLLFRVRASASSFVSGQSHSSRPLFVSFMHPVSIVEDVFAH